MRLLAICAALALGCACSTLSRVNGAKTLEPGQAQIGVSGTIQRAGNPLSVGTLPLPQAEVFGRIGLVENVDAGLRLYLVGAGFDVRYRFYHQNRVHFAVDPALSAVWLPFVGGLPAGQGSFDVRAPVIGELEFGKQARNSISGGPTLLLRNQYNSVDMAELGKGRLWRLDAYAGGGLRYEGRPGGAVIGVVGDIFATPARNAGIAYALGVDLSVRTRQKKSYEPRAP